MIKRRSLRLLVASAFLCSLTLTQAQTLRDIILQDVNYQELRTSLQKADLIDALGGPGPFTLFAPPDAAFNALPSHYYEGLKSNTNALSRVLLYHVMDGDLRDSDLPAGTYGTLEGSTIQVSTLGTTKLVNEIELNAVDRVADNGVLHQVAGVLTPPPPPATELTSEITRDQLRLSWIGGQGAFMIQEKSNLNDADWIPAAPVTPNRSIDLLVDADNAYFRIADTVQLGAGLRSAFVVPPVTTTGFGEGRFTLVGNRLIYRITYSGLPSPVTAAHIHGPASTNETGGVLYSLIPGRGSAGLTSGSIPSGDGVWDEQIPQSLVEVLLQGKAYINIHTETSPDGAIRGQILPLP